MNHPEAMQKCIRFARNMAPNGFEICDKATGKFYWWDDDGSITTLHKPTLNDGWLPILQSNDQIHKMMVMHTTGDSSMNYETSALETGYAYRDIDSGRIEVYDKKTNSFYVADTSNQVISRKPGRGSKTKDDWTKLSDASKVVHDLLAFQAQAEDRGLTIEHPWYEACMNSPVNRAYRAAKDGFLMVRSADKHTYSEQRAGQIFAPVKGAFKEYDGWEAMPADHKYASIDLTEDKTYRSTINGEIQQPRPKTTTTNYVEVPVEVLSVAGTVAQSLASVLVSGVGTQEQQTKLLEELTRLSNHVSWHLREDRRKYQGDKNG
jgi:hypothetical protein